MIDKVYILISGWSGEIVGVYSSLEKAEQAQVVCERGCLPIIKEYTIDQE